MRPFNPWMPVLWLLGVALTAAGVWAFYESALLAASPNIDNVRDYYVTPAVLGALAPWLFGSGVATVVGTVFLHAVRWTGRRGA